MNMQNVLKILIPDGFEIDTYDGDTGEVTFKPIQPQITPEELFLQFFDGCVIRFDRKEYPYSIFYFDKDGNFLADFYPNDNTFWVNYYKVWELFQTTFSLNYDSTKVLLNKLVEECFKQKGFTTRPVNETFISLVEEHFKREDDTIYMIDETTGYLFQIKSK
jgi:hypothetical protein